VIGEKANVYVRDIEPLDVAPSEKCGEPSLEADEAATHARMFRMKRETSSASVDTLRSGSG